MVNRLATGSEDAFEVVHTQLCSIPPSDNDRSPSARAPRQPRRPATSWSVGVPPQTRPDLDGRAQSASGAASPTPSGRSQNPGSALKTPSFAVANSQAAVNHTVSGVHVLSKIVSEFADVRRPHPPHLMPPSLSRQHCRRRAPPDTEATPGSPACRPGAEPEAELTL